MDKLTPERLREIAERRKKIDYTGKWSYIPEGNVIYGEDIPVAEEIGHGYEGEFIAASYTDIPDLLSHIAVLEEEIDENTSRIKELEAALKYADRVARHGFAYDAEYVTGVLKRENGQ